MKWVVQDPPDRDVVHALREALDLPRVIAGILYQRGIQTPEEAERFFYPDWDEMYDPFLILDMDKAAARLKKAIQANERIFVYGDYDVDGITSVSLLSLFLKSVGSEVFFYIPDRLNEGYGLSRLGVENAHKVKATLMISVDCGITGVNEVAYANELGIDVIVSDHHEPGSGLPDAVAILDPKREGCTYPFQELAGVGVAYKLIQAVCLELGLEESYSYDFLDLVALGSAADIVPMVDENRLLVRKGLEKFNTLERTGIKALVEGCGLLGKRIGTGQLVFMVAPRINAVGRLGNAERAVNLLITDSDRLAKEIAHVLEAENQHRKNIDEQTFQEALKQVEDVFDPEQHRAVVLAQEGWHSGVIGIVASRIAEKIYRPTIMVAIEDGMGKGSARSIANFDIHSALQQCEDLLEGFGGHKFAAGLSIKTENIEAFTRRIQDVAQETLSEEDLVQSLRIDAEIDLEEVNDNLMRYLNLFAPFGPKNMRPVFISRNVQVVGTPRIVGKNHLKFRVAQSGHVLDAIGFNLGDYLYRLTPGENNLDMVYVVEENFWNNQVRLQLRVKDLR